MKNIYLGARRLALLLLYWNRDGFPDGHEGARIHGLCATAAREGSFNDWSKERPGTGT